MTSTELDTTTHALYRFYDRSGTLLYVGITNNPSRRWAQHQSSKPWWHDVARIELETHPDRASVLAAEQTAIQLERPRHNVKHTGERTEPAAAPSAAVADYPVAVGDCVALGLADALGDQTDPRSCPVGAVSAVGPWGVALELMSFWSGEFDQGKVTIRWERIEEIRHARPKPRDEWDALDRLAEPTVVFDTVPLGDFQTAWVHGPERMKEEQIRRYNRRNR